MGNNGLDCPAAAAAVEFARVNSFTDNPFGGNPAAVCFLPHEKEDEWLQKVAKEFNLSETAFLIKRPITSVEDGVPEYNLRWFTPTVEVDLCGHATLAAAHSLFSTRVDQDKILFHTKSGILKASKISGYEQSEQPASGPMAALKQTARSSSKGLVELDFPLSTATPCDDQETTKVCKSLRVPVPESVWCGKNDLGDYLVELRSSEQVTKLDPEFDAMMDFPGRGGVIVTAQALEKSDIDFISRFFCPKSGILEDPVCGSAHCALGPYWSKKLQRSRVTGYQASERGGKIFVRVSEIEGRAYLQGSAITSMAGVLLNVENDHSTKVV